MLILLSKYCISNSVLKYASFIKKCTPDWALLNQNLTPLNCKVNASLKSKFNTQKHCFNSQKHSALKQQICGSISKLFRHTSKAIHARYKITMLLLRISITRFYSALCWKLLLLVQMVVTNQMIIIYSYFNLKAT